jgi:asparagine synthase (glutamine-hydrolysing)
MPYRYLVVLEDGHAGNGAACSADPALRHLGLLPRLMTDSVSVLAPADTPTMLIPGGDILVGHLFMADGTPLGHAQQLPVAMSQAQLRAFVVNHCWGDYVLIQSSRNGSRGPELTITRDPSGGVRCVYASSEQRAFATSDLPFATQCGLYHRRIDWDFIAHCLVYPHLMTARTGLAGVRELLPGHTLQLRPSSITSAQVWSPWDFVAAKRRHADAEEAAACVRHSVMTAVAAWAGTSSSIMLELSGGLDSSIIASCLKSTDVEVDCCTLITPVPGADERHYAALVADDLGVALRTEELAFDAVRIDAPPPPWSVAPRINVLQHALNVTMTQAGDHASPCHFSGGGGDTIFCYLGNASPAADAFLERGVSAGVTAIRELSVLHQCTLWKAARLTLNKLCRPPKAPYQADRSLLSAALATVSADEHPWFTAPQGALPGDKERIQYLAGTQLYRHGMWRGATRDLRLPLLSQPIVQACLGVPSWMWIAGGRNRSVARAAFSDRLPEPILQRKSKGDFAQYLGAAYRRNKERMRDFLLEGELQGRGLLAPDELRDFFQRPMSVRDQSFFRILDLCMIENWVRHQR